MDLGSLIGRILVPAAVVVIFGLLRKYMPPSKTSLQGKVALGQASEEFKRTEWFVGLSMAVVGIVIAYVSHKALVMANQHFANADGPAAFRLLPSAAIWWFFPGFAAASLAWEITRLFWSLFGDSDKIARYTDLGDARAGFASTKLLRWMALLIAMPIGIATILALPIRSSLRDNDIVAGHYAQLKPQYLPYSQARRMVLVNGLRDRNGKFTTRAELLVDFDNGVRWSSAANRDFMPQVDLGLVDYVSQKTGLPVEHAETEAEIRAQAR